MPLERNEALRGKTCPHCARALDYAEPIQGAATPKPGDHSLCGYCARWLIFDENLDYQPSSFEAAAKGLTPPEVEALKAGETAAHIMIRLRARSVARSN